MKKIIATVASLLMCGAAHAQTSQTFGAFMAGLPSATTPLSDSDVLYVLQGSTSAKVARSSLYSPFSYLHSGSGTPSATPPFFAFDSETYNAGAGVFYEPFVFQENVACPGASCGERNTMVVKLTVENGQATQFYNTFEPAAYARSGSGNYSASNPYVLICAASGTGPCAAATGVSASAEAVGEEVDTDVRVASVARKVALQLVSVSTDIGVASNQRLDGALLIANQAGGAGFLSGIIFGEDASQFGVYGNYLYAPSGSTPTNYINFPNMIVTGAGTMTLAGNLNATNVAVTTTVAIGGAPATNPLNIKTAADHVLRFLDGAGAARIDAVNLAGNAYVPMLVGGSTVNIHSSGTIALAIDASQNVQVATYLQTNKVTVASLPACGAANEGAHYAVTNATATTFASIVAGGGANRVPVYCNGTNWVIG